MSPEHWFSIATIGAVILGPILAVYITRIIDERRFDKTRKLEIFRTLMRTRQLSIHPEHVGALNLVEVEFADNQKVIDAWQAYLKILGEPIPPLEEKGRFDKFIKNRDNLLTKLIYEISIVLKFKVEQIDILQGNYVPKVWHDDDWEQRLTRHLLINVLSGRASLKIRPEVNQMESSPFPPPPAKAESDN